MEVLLSDKNPLLKQVRRAVQKGSLTDDGFAVAEGFHLLEEALKSNAEIGAVIVAQSVRSAIESHVKGLKLRVVHRTRRGLPTPWRRPNRRKA